VESTARILPGPGPSDIAGIRKCAREADDPGIVAFVPLRRLAEVVSGWSRDRRMAFIVDHVGAGATIVDVGVDDGGGRADGVWAGANALERLWPAPERITAVGLGPGEHFQVAFPAVGYVQADGRRLPFDDRAFGVAYSNAVIEHLPDRDEQERLVAELARVADLVVIATPNRWFPVEVHTLLPLVHWLPERTYPGLLARLSPAHGRDLRLLTPAALRRLVPPEFEVIDQRRGITATVVARRRT
jgi:SAM-dependent methyltransferase